MPLLERFTQSAWDEYVRSLDQIIFAAIERDITNRALDAHDLVHGCTEVVKLRRGQEPDYSVRGVAPIYNFTYLAQRVSSLALAFTKIELADNVVVLDIGAGTGATSIALQMFRNGRRIRLTASDPSAEMQAAATALDCPDLSINHLARPVEYVLRTVPPIDHVWDMIVLSACLPYRFGQSQTATQGRSAGLNIARRLAPGGCVLVVEPKSKLTEPRRMRAWLSAAGLRTVELSSDDLNKDELVLERRLPRATSKLAEWSGRMTFTRELVGDAATLIHDSAGWLYAVKSWNPRASEHYLVASA